MTILAVAFCPGPPLLVPDLAGAGATAVELDPLRVSCDAVVTAACSVGSGRDLPVVVLGAAPTPGRFDGTAAGTLRPYGVDVRAGTEADPTLPLSLTLGAWLLDRAGIASARRTYIGLASGDPIPEPPSDDCVLLVVGDGSATRTAKAPGSFHPEAEAYDASVAATFASGDPRQLAALDAPLARAVGAAGARAWGVAAQWWGDARAATARVEADEAPYGVGYLVGLWLR